MSPLRPRPAPAADEIFSRPIHVLVRDYPETHAVLLRHDVRLSAAGARTLDEVAVPDAAGLKQALLDAMAWRPAP